MSIDYIAGGDTHTVTPHTVGGYSRRAEGECCVYTPPKRLVNPTYLACGTILPLVALASDCRANSSGVLCCGAPLGEAR